MSAPVIRDAVEGDAAAIARVHVQSWQETYRGLIPDAVINARTVEERQAMWARILERGQAVFVAEQAGQVIGFVNAGATRETHTAKGELYALYVLAEHHHKGIGSALFKAMRNNLRDEGLLPFFTWVLEGNPAQRFYEKLGAERIGEKEDDFGSAVVTEIQLFWK